MSKKISRSTFLEKRKSRDFDLYDDPNIQGAPGHGREMRARPRLSLLVTLYTESRGGTLHAGTTWYVRIRAQRKVGRPLIAAL